MRGAHHDAAGSRVGVLTRRAIPSFVGIARGRDLIYKGLTAGHRYLVQIFAHNSYGDSYITIGSETAVSIRDGQYATVYGSFDASISQVIRAASGSAQSTPLRSPTSAATSSTRSPASRSACDRSHRSEGVLQESADLVTFFRFCRNFARTYAIIFGMRTTATHFRR